MHMSFECEGLYASSKTHRTQQSNLGQPGLTVLIVRSSLQRLMVLGMRHICRYTTRLSASRQGSMYRLPMPLSLQTSQSNLLFSCHRANIAMLHISMLPLSLRV